MVTSASRWQRRKVVRRVLLHVVVNRASLQPVLCRGSQQRHASDDGGLYVGTMRRRADRALTPATARGGLRRVVRHVVGSSGWVCWRSWGGFDLSRFKVGGLPTCRVV